MGFLKNLLRPSTPWVTEVRELAIDRTVSDPANKQGYGSSRENAARIINSLPDQDIINGTPEALIFRIVELYSTHGDANMPEDLKLMRGVEASFLHAAAKRREQSLGRRLSEAESKIFTQEELSKLPKPLTLESYIDYRVLSIDNPGISKPFVDKARSRAIQYFGVKKIT